MTRWHHASVDAVRSEAGVADQSDECRNGTVGCPGPDADVDELPCFSCLLEAGSNREVATDGGHDIDLERVRSKTDHLVRLASRRSQHLHLPATESSIDDPVTLCWVDRRDDATPRGCSHDHFDDDGYVTENLCGNCIKKWLGREPNDGDTAKYGRTPADILDENGFGAEGGESA